MRSSLIAAVAFCLSVQAVAAGETARPLLIKVRIEHNDRLEPLAEPLRPGSRFQESSLASKTKDNRWFQIPAWLAGTWKEEHQMRVWKRDATSGRATSVPAIVVARAEEPWGEQQDARGGIWQFVHTGQLTKTAGRGVWAYAYIKAVEPISVSESRVAVRVELKRLIVDSDSGKITQAVQAEQLVIYKPRGEGVIKVTGSVRDFDARGKPMSTSRLSYVAQRVKEFQPVDSFGDKDLKELFCAFLKKSGRAELVPD